MNPPQDAAPAADYFPLPRPVKQKIKDGLVALAVAHAAFARALSQSVYSGSRYYDNQTVGPMDLAALALNILGLALVIWIGIGLWRRAQSKWLLLVLDLLFLMWLLPPVDFVRAEIMRVSDAQLAAFLKQPVMLAGEMILALLILWRHRLVARAVAMVSVLAFPAAALTLAKILLLGTGLMHLHPCPVFVPAPAMSPVKDGQARVVWIIFDETDYRLAFEKRPASVSLPEFDRLRQQALSADHAYAPADMTILSMPALISGRRVAWAVRHECDLALEWDDNHTTNDWTTVPTVFSKAREMGVNTALLGWYVPYGRLLGASLNYCAWYGLGDYQPTNQMSFGEVMLSQIDTLAWPFDNRRIYISICQRSLQDARPIVADPKYGLTLLHLPPPHFPGVYLADRKKFTCLGISRPFSYLNNLALADSMLGELRGAMEASGEWDKSWVILSADHSWRSSQTYDGVRDYRVPYLIKPPGAGAPATYAKPFNTVVTRDLILAILGGQVTNTAGAAGWLDDHGKMEMPVKAPANAVFE